MAEGVCNGVYNPTILLLARIPKLYVIGFFFVSNENQNSLVQGAENE